MDNVLFEEIPKYILFNGNLYELVHKNIPSVTEYKVEMDLSKLVTPYCNIQDCEKNKMGICIRNKGEDCIKS